MARKATQCEKVLHYMNTFGSITQFEAYRDLGVSRLASRISDLKEQGYVIIGKHEAVKNRFDETCYVKRYRLLDGDAQ